MSNNNGTHAHPDDKQLATKAAMPPGNMHAEEAVLGALLIDPDAILDILDIVRADDFFIRRHGWIYEAILALHEKREPADLITLTDKLERRGQLDDIGGASYLTGLITKTPTSIHAEHYAKIVRDTATLRRVIAAAGEIAVLAHDGADDVAAIVREAESIWYTVDAGRSSSGNLVGMREGVSEYHDEFAALTAGHIQSGISTGLKDLDLLTGGLKKGFLTTVAGATGMGKTSLALHLSLAAAREGKCVAIFSLEMTRKEIYDRLVANETGINSQKIADGLVDDDELVAVTAALAKMSELPMWVDDGLSATPGEIRAQCIKQQARYGLDMVIVDYIQLMSSGIARLEGETTKKIDYISRSLKLLARELDVPLVALSQLSRDFANRRDKRPILSDLRWSGSIEQDSNVVVFCYLDSEYNPDADPHVAELIVAKNRGGPTGITSVFCDLSTMKFADLAFVNGEEESLPWFAE